MVYRKTNRQMYRHTYMKTNKTIYYTELLKKGSVVCPPQNLNSRLANKCFENKINPSQE